ncbi:sugar transferase [Pararhodobacter oceanensis]|uniref:Sugar transferase n=1 Tax=Pararhodobacter oceanensis TaxID=2172121 RepID=A0A2T8HQ01_9RHOB|nr:sugar transferase [Pararhodobacter oceanensis]
MIYRDHIKRALDLTFVLLALAVLGIPILLAMVVVKLCSPGPIFYYQTRVGLGEKPFRILKLRTMTVNPNRVSVQTTNHDPEVYPAGKVLRRLKIDELPQLFNILRGDMSFVGPRPCLVQTRNTMPDWALRRFKVRPGITGLAQVNGNITLTWEERWKHDIEYVDRASLPLDVATCFRTFVVVLFGEERFKNPL